MGVEIVDNDTHKELEANVDSDEDEDVEEDGHILRADIYNGVGQGSRLSAYISSYMLYTCTYMQL